MVNKTFLPSHHDIFSRNKKNQNSAYFKASAGLAPHAVVHVRQLFPYGLAGFPRKEIDAQLLAPFYPVACPRVRGPWWGVRHCIIYIKIYNAVLVVSDTHQLLEISYSFIQNIRRRSTYRNRNTYHLASVVGYRKKDLLYTGTRRK